MTTRKSIRTMRIDDGNEKNHAGTFCAEQSSEAKNHARSYSRTMRIPCGKMMMGTIQLIRRGNASSNCMPVSFSSTVRTNYSADVVRSLRLE